MTLLFRFQKYDYLYVANIMEYLSKERYDEILAELNNLIYVEYPKLKEDLSEARAQGDLSENAGYRAARRTQARMISRINYLQNILNYARVIDPSNLPKDQVALLCTVEFTILNTGAKKKYTIVSPHEMDMQAGKISFKSPIGQALMGKKEGDIAEARTPSGILRLQIDSVSY